VGGDFYDFVPLESGNVGIVIADVSDKGMPAALFMALTRSLIRAEASRGVFPPDVLRRVNRHLLEISESGMFVTVLYGILHGRNGEFLYARAGHELPLLFDAAGQVVALPSSRGQPLGLLPDPDLDEQSILLRPGHRLVLTTDGVTDAINRQQEEFGRERLQRLVSRQTDVSARAVCELVHEAVKAHEEGMPQFDDFTLVVVQTQLAGAR
jgi:sigma-B regulation protein RsbU (phosphoserine phosphatase)